MHKRKQSTFLSLRLNIFKILLVAIDSNKKLIRFGKRQSKFCFLWIIFGQLLVYRAEMFGTLITKGLSFLKIDKRMNVQINFLEK